MFYYGRGMRSEHCILNVKTVHKIMEENGFQKQHSIKNLNLIFYLILLVLYKIPNAIGSVEDEDLVNRIDKSSKLKVSENVSTEMKEARILDREEISFMSKSDLRIFCKYRLSCYEDNGVLEEMVGDKKKNIATGLSTKAIPKIKKQNKKTVKEIATETLKKLNSDAKFKKKPKMNPGHHVLEERKASLEEKIKCKYRKSCYKTGILPELQRENFGGWLEFDDDDGENNEEEEEEPFEEMDEKKRKLFCRYRKSCYATGIRPIFKKTEDKSGYEYYWQHINDYLIWIGFEGKKEVKGEKEQIEASIKPTNVKELKLFCKYRKSCYIKQSLMEEGQTREEEKEEEEDKESENIHSEQIVIGHFAEEPETAVDKYKEKAVARVEKEKILKTTKEATITKRKSSKPCNLLKQKSSRNPETFSCIIPRDPDETLKKTEKKKDSPKILETKETAKVGSKITEAKQTKGKRKTKKYTAEAKIIAEIEEDGSETKGLDEGNESEILESKEGDDKSKDWDETNISVELLQVPSEEQFVIIENWDKLSTVEQMRACKYHKSCYEAQKYKQDGEWKEKENSQNITKQFDEMEKSEKGKINGNGEVKCNKYRISCREKLGLPVTERAPIGPNGRKLCRRQKRQKE